MSRALLLFARAPESEALAKGLHPARAAPLFRALVAAWIRAAQRAGATPIIASSSADRRQLLSISPTANPLWIEQRGTAFGERLAGAASDAFAHGFGAVLIAGIDAPPPREIGSAYALLEGRGAEAVIVPARDGGANLIGLRMPACELLRTISAGQRDVVRRFRDRFPKLVVLSPPQSDIDSPDDLRHASREASWAAFRPLLLDCLSETPTLFAPAREQTRAFAVRTPRAPPRPA